MVNSVYPPYTLTLIGATDWQAQEKPNPKALDAETFFAPARVKLRQGEWGHEVFLAKYAKTWQGFAHKTDSTFYERSCAGTDAIVKLFLDTLQGVADTKTLNMLSFE